MGPIDYTIGGNLPSPTQSFLQGIQVVDALKAREQQQLMQAQAQEAEKQRQAMMADLQAKARAGTLGPGDFEAMKIADPKNYQAWDSSIQRLDTAKKDAAWSNMSPVWYGLSLGTSEGVNTATDHLQTQLRAAENSGDKQTAAQVQGVLSAIATPEGRADILAKTGGTLNAIDPKRFKESWDNLMAVKGGPDDLKRKAAEAAKLQAEALVAGKTTDIQNTEWYLNASSETKRAYTDLIRAKNPAAVTRVEISNNIDKSGAAEIGKLLPVFHEKIVTAASQLGDIPRYREALKGAFTGPFANAKLEAAKLAEAVGLQGSDAIPKTREVIQGLAQMALDARGLLAGQGPITESEQKLLIQAKSGDINMSARELETLLGVAERASKAQYAKNKKLLESAKAQGSNAAGLFLENVPELPQAAPSVVVGGKTYAKPASMSDADWAAYKAEMGAK